MERKWTDVEDPLMTLLQEGLEDDKFVKKEYNVYSRGTHIFHITNASEYEEAHKAAKAYVKAHPAEEVMIICSLRTLSLKTVMGKKNVVAQKEKR